MKYNVTIRSSLIKDLKTVRVFPSYSTDWLLFGRSSESPVNYPEAIEQDSPSTVQDIAFTTNPMTRESSTDSRLTYNSQAEIDKIVLLYKDGRFTEYIPKND